MYRNWELYGFPLMRLRISYGGHKHRLHRRDLQYLRLLGQIVRRAPVEGSSTRGSLLPMRDDFRVMVQTMSPIVFAFLLQRTSAAPM